LGLVADGSVTALRPSRASGGSHALSDPNVRYTPYTPGHARKPRAGCDIANNALRPHVPAKDCLQLWIAPAGVRASDETATKFSNAASSQLFEVTLASLDVATRKTYVAGLLRFHQFCNLENVAEESRMPASDRLLATYAAWSAGSVLGDTTGNWIAGVHTWHDINQALWLAGDMLRRAKAGTVKLTPSTLVQPKRNPVTVAHLHALLRALDLSNLFNAAVWAAACFAFWGCCRLGEVVTPGALSDDKDKCARRGAPQSFMETAAGVVYYKVHIPWSKTKHVKGPDIRLVARNDPLCPVYTMRQHFAANKDVPADAPLFGYASGANGSWAALTKDSFLSRCEQVWVSHPKLEAVQGHSFRIGGATEMLLEGKDPSIVRVHRRWESDAFLAYWRQINAILPLFLAGAFGAERAALTKQTMSVYTKRRSRK
jgi:hypothetical protein